MEIKINYKFKGVIPLDKKVTEQQFDKAVRLGTDDLGYGMVTDLKKYPVKRKTRSYKRTRTLGRSWFYKSYPVGPKIGEIFSSGKIAPYNIYVQSRKFQAEVHRKVWLNTDHAVIKKFEPKHQTFYDKRFNELLK
jgi:hypothetical protein